jgi:phosphatidylserine decarboxylase
MSELDFSSQGPTLGARLFVGMQHLLPQHTLSRLIHRVARARSVSLKNALISNFVKHFRPDMSDAVEPNPLAYDCFNDFFTRALKPESRRITGDPQALASPVDGTVSQIGMLDEMRLIQAKGRHYRIDTLLSGPPEYNNRFADGAFATLYLAPYNYHRIHMPMAGTLRAAWYVPGKLYSVNATTAASVPELFAINERVVCIFEQGPIEYAMVLVGALFVGSITTIWHGDITPRSPRRYVNLPLPQDPATASLAKGDEMGRFNMGSTVILVYPRDSIGWNPAIGPGSVIRVGQPLATLHTAIA